MLYVSGYTDDVLDAAELTHEDTAFISKPFQNDELISVVEELLGETRLVTH